MPMKLVRAKPRALDVLPKRRLSVRERERQIVQGAVQFFAEHGFEGQLRELAAKIGMAHTLLYHYFPTKQALIERVYRDVVEARWNPAWEVMLDDPKLDAEEKFMRFYREYLSDVLTYDFVRIFIYSGLAKQSIDDRFFALLRERLFPRLVRETRRYAGSTSRARPSMRELELLIGLHGSIFYVAMRRYVYGQAVHSGEPLKFDDIYVRDRVRSYLLSARAVLDAPARKHKATGGESGAAPPQGRLLPRGSESGPLRGPWGPTRSV